MEGFDVDRFVRERRPDWEALGRLLDRADLEGMASLDLDDARRLGRLYWATTNDLVRARGALVDASIVDALNDLVARAYVRVHGRIRRRPLRLLERFLYDYPRNVRAEWRLVVLSAALFAAGASLGAIATAVDRTSHGVLLPEQHQAWSPEERVSEEEATGGEHDAGTASAFSSFLFTHNIGVSFTVFALGLTFGVGSAALLFYNGVPLGALAVEYHQADRGLFFWAWILPHGIPEILEILIAGAAGLVLARGLWLPGRRRRRDALRAEARRAVELLIGGIPLLVLAGVIEGTISQIHEPTIRYEVKLAFAAIVGVAVFGYLLLAGRSRDEQPVASQPHVEEKREGLERVA